MIFKELRELSGMNMSQFAKYFGINYRTIQRWEYGERKCPDYLLSLMEYKMIHEGLINVATIKLDDSFPGMVVEPKELPERKIPEDFNI